MRNKPEDKADKQKSTSHLVRHRNGSFNCVERDELAFGLQPNEAVENVSSRVGCPFNFTGDSNHVEVTVQGSSPSSSAKPGNAHHGAVTLIACLVTALRRNDAGKPTMRRVIQCFRLRASAALQPVKIVEMCK
jgi:hypothetical protein